MNFSLAQGGYLAAGVQYLLALPQAMHRLFHLHQNVIVLCIWIRHLPNHAL